MKKTPHIGWFCAVLHFLKVKVILKDCLKAWTKIIILTRNVMRSNNRDDLLHLSFTLKISIFSYITQWDIYDGAFIMKIVSR